MEEVFFGDPRLPLRFWDKVHINKETGCWEWTAGRFDKGYGLFSLTKDEAKRTRLAHRAAFIATRFDPGSLVCDHLCRVRHCVNVNHLRAVTDKVNVLSGVGPSAVNARKTHCVNGHEFTPENTTVRQERGTEHRECRTCARVKDARRGRGGRTYTYSGSASTHGTPGKYRAGCRCRECKDQQRDRMRAYRSERRAKIASHRETLP